MRSRTIASIVLAFLVPGAGHFFLGKRGRAIAYCAIVVILFGIGIAVDGRIDTPQGGLLNLLCTVAAAGNGLLYFVVHAHENIRSATFEYGTNFIRTAGLMNLLLMLDAFDIAEERKK
jgi:TM2 domain-containing membrane protein YozV